jgi:hypothetical protein
MLIFRENDTQAIGEFIFFEGYSDAIGRLSGGLGRPYLRLSNRTRSDNQQDEQRKRKRSGFRQVMLQSYKF